MRTFFILEMQLFAWAPCCLWRDEPIGSDMPTASKYNLHSKYNCKAISQQSDETLCDIKKP